MADLISDTLSNSITKLTFYGLYFIPETNLCEVYKLNVVLGKDTVALKGKEKLSISESFNRVLGEITA